MDAGFLKAVGRIAGLGGLAVGGDTTFQGPVTLGMTLAEVSRELGVTTNAVMVFFQILDEKNVPTEHLTLRLVEIAQRHKALLRELPGFQGDDPAVAALKQLPP